MTEYYAGLQLSGVGPSFPLPPKKKILQKSIYQVHLYKIYNVFVNVVVRLSVWFISVSTPASR